MIGQKNIVVGFSAPSETTCFVGREKFIEAIRQLLLQKKPVAIAGPAGVGKTALAIRLAHLLYEDFPYGILWYRLDTKGFVGVLEDVAKKFGYNINRLKTVKDKVAVVKKALSSGNILVILDNVTNPNDLAPLFEEEINFPLLITSRSLNVPKNFNFFLLPVFTRDEAISFAVKILSLDFVSKNLAKINLACQTLGYLPLAVSVFLRQVFLSPWRFNFFIKELLKNPPQLTQLVYDEKNLYASLSLSFNELTDQQKAFFSSLGVFEGADFSKEAAAEINSLSLEKTSELLEELKGLSLVEGSAGGRFRLHPLVRVFARQKMENDYFYHRLFKYYLNFLEKGGVANLQFYPKIDQEQENLIGLFKQLLSRGNYQAALKIWSYIGVFLWDTGYWRLMSELGPQVYKAAEKINDFYNQAAIAIKELAWLFFWQGDLNRAEKYAQVGLDLARKLKNEFLINFAEQRLAKVYQAKGKLKLSLKFLEKNLQYFEKSNQWERAGDTMTYLGETLWLLKQHQEAENYFFRALSLVKKIKDVRQECIIYNRLGGLYLVKKDYPRAKKYFILSIKLENKIGRRVGGIAWNNIGLGLIKEELGDFEEAKKIYKIAREDIAYLGIGKIDRTNFFVNAVKSRLLKSQFFRFPRH
ncbi:MAG: tetratricopeptide repeat protein [Microgenomates group bacterium]|nr:tetratricopeptide repeat protein [Microgenomates group bacterium]